LTPAIDSAGEGNIVAGTVASAVVGGTASELGGGKFANGAATAAFQFLFNQAATSVQREQQKLADFAKLKASLSVRTFQTAQRAAEGFCDLGGCGFTLRFGVEVGANIQELGKGSFRLVDFVLGDEGSVIMPPADPNPRAPRTVANVHTHPSTSGPGFSGGVIRQFGIKPDRYDGDIEINYSRNLDGYVFRVPQGDAWHFNQTAFRNASTKNGEVHSGKFLRKFR